MAVLKFGEVFGVPVDQVRKNELPPAAFCPFKKAPCNKVSLSRPLGVCSYTDGRRLATVCPSRFLENNRLFRDAANLAFGPKVPCVVLPEYRLLTVSKGGKKSKIGKIDFLLGKLVDEEVRDFAALEVQSVYVSGLSTRKDFENLIINGVDPPESANRRMDYRSSAQKRLVPQLSLKLPIFRRWGKGFLVAVDRLFFDSLPPFPRARSIEDSELTWLVYPFVKENVSFSMGSPEVIHAQWEDVLTSLREGDAPTKDTVICDLNSAHLNNRGASFLV